MKKIILGLVLAVVLLASAPPALAYTRVRGYVRRSTGTYVMPHYRTNYNRTRYDNFSTRGNYNPFTGRRGYTSLYR